MKKFVCAVALLTAAGMCFANKLEDQLKKIIIKSEPCEYQKVYQNEDLWSYKGEITYAQMEEDLANLKYILETSYAGYDDACARGMNLDTVISNVKEKFAGQETVYSKYMAMRFYDETKAYIRDTHFQTYLKEQAVVFCQHNFVYYADFYVEKGDEGNFSSEEGQLFPYYKDGVKKFRVGRISADIVSDVSFTLKGKKYQIPVKNYPVKEPEGIVKYSEKETIQSAFIKLESFNKNTGDAGKRNLQRFGESSSIYLDDSNIIVDLRSNTGGSREYGNTFVSGCLFKLQQNIAPETVQVIRNTLNAKWAEIESDCYTLASPATMQIDEIIGCKNKFWTKKIKKDPAKYYLKTHLDDESAKKMKFPKVPAFKGQLFIIIDRYSASASEEFVMLAKQCLGDENVTVIGENSMGCDAYTGLMDFSLPNSQITYHVAVQKEDPAMRKLSNWQGEGNGIYPDVWSTDEDMLETLVAVTGDEGLRKALEGMD